MPRRSIRWGLLTLPLLALIAAGFGTYGGDPSSTRLAQARFGKTVNLTPTEGVIRIRLPREQAYVDLDKPRQVPLGTLIDARKGVVKLVSATQTPGRTRSGKFSGGKFTVGQSRRSGVTVLELRGGSFERCNSSGSVSVRRYRRELLSRANGRFRTRGRYSSATVYGTEWRTSESCRGTRTSVTEGKVVVRDFVRQESVKLPIPPKPCNPRPGTACSPGPTITEYLARP